MTAPTLILGLGNVLLQDDGLGVWAVASLKRGFRFPPHVSLVDGGTLGIELLPLLDGVERLLLVDAVRWDGLSGTIVRLEGASVPEALNLKMSPHQVGAQDLLAAAELLDRRPPCVVVFGMVPEQLEPGVALSPQILRALPELEEAVLQELRGWGIGCTPLEPAEGPVAWSPSRLAAVR